MKPDKHFVFAAAILVVAASLVALTWVGATKAIRAERIDNIGRVTDDLSNQALTFTEQINRQILAIDQTLRFLVAAWEMNPRGFELEAARKRSVVLSGLSRDLVMTDETGVIRQSSVVEAINQNASGLDYFRALAGAADSGDGLYISSAAIDGMMRQWHMNVARALHYPDGSFAGVIDADYRIAAITDVFSETKLGSDPFIALVGLEDGKLRGVVSATTIDPDTSIAGTPLLAAIRQSDSGIWTGPSASDAVTRIHAFRRLPGRNLAVVVAMDEAEASRPADEFRHQAWFAAGCISVLVTVLAIVLVLGTRAGRRHEAMGAEDRALLAAANAQLEVAKAMADAKAEQLEATLAAMTDGVVMVDANMCLTEWSARFPEIAGVPPDMLRVGLPVEQIIKAQIRPGPSDVVHFAENEVEQRLARLRSAMPGVTQQQNADGRILEMRRRRLPDGGFALSFTDVTERKRAEEALQAIRADHRNRARTTAALSQQARTVNNSFIDMIQSLNEPLSVPSQHALVTTARRSGDVLRDLCSDILGLSLEEDGKLAFRPTLFEVRPMLDSCVEILQPEASQRGLTIGVQVGPGTPTMLLTDPRRFHQVQLGLLGYAVKHARGKNLWVIAEAGRNGGEAIRLTVRDDGIPVPAGSTHGAKLASDFPNGLGNKDTFDANAGDADAGLALCHDLVNLMKGQIGYDHRRSEDGLEGVEFWVTLPGTALSNRNDMSPLREAAPSTEPLPLEQTTLSPESLSRHLPRTRILVTKGAVDDSPGPTTLLRRDGHYVDIAWSNVDALKAIKTRPYDLMFMRTAMPGLDARELARTMRDLPEPACSTPIIALVTDLLPGDEIELASAGIDACLAYPASGNALLDMLRDKVWNIPRNGEPAVPDRPRGFPSSLSIERIDELRSNLPPEVFANLVEECLVDMDHRLPALRRALLAQAPGAIAAHAHAMVGMAAGYGMAKLETRLRMVIDASREGNLSALTPTLSADIQRDFDEAAQSLRNILRPEVA